jgi:hypothetical protein
MAGNIEVFRKAVDSGLILTKFKLCCPDCNGAYSLTNYQDFQTYYQVYTQLIQNGNDVGDLCCLSIFVDDADWTDFIGKYGDDFPDLQHVPTTYGDASTQCGATSDFMFYINQLSVLLGSSFIQDYVLGFGILEINTIGGHSGLKFIYEFLLSTGLTQSEMQAMFMIIMGNPKEEEKEKGLLIRCVNDDILISTTQQYFGFLSSFYGANLYLCLKTLREREGQTTTYQYLNILPQSNLVNGEPFYVINYNEGGITGTYYIFWSITNSRWEVWSGFNTTTNTGTGTFHSSLVSPTLDIFLTTDEWDDQTSLTNGVVYDSSLKVECDETCNFKTENG